MKHTLLILCQDGRLLAGAVRFAAICQGELLDGFAMLDGQPAVLASQPIIDATNGQTLGLAMAGRWLDGAALTHLGTDTGVAQSLISPDGVRQTSSIGGAAGTAVTLPPPDSNSQEQLNVQGDRYFALYTALPAANGQPSLVAEAALPVNNLVQTENQALLILAASTVLVAVLAGSVGSWYVRQLVAPLQKLTNVAEQISGGDLIAPIPSISTPTEVSTLAAPCKRARPACCRHWKKVLRHGIG